MARRKNRRSTKASQGKALNTGRALYDLDVPMILKGAKGYVSKGREKRNQKGSSMSQFRGSLEEHQVLNERLQDIGYSAMAFSHTIHGRIIPERDEAFNAIPISSAGARGNSNMKANDKTTKKRKFQDDSSEDDCVSNCDEKNTTHRNCRILRRLNVVIEQVSDLTHYSYNDLSVAEDDQITKQKYSVLNSYDLIALSPRNDAAFSSACTSNNLLYSDIITLDYTTGRGNIQLPYKLKTSDIAAATRRGITFEIPYGPALVDPVKRKAFVQTAQLFMTACVGVSKPRIILCSGCRTFEGKDYGAMAFRSPGDMMNFGKVVLGFDDHLVNKVLNDHASYVVSRGNKRRMGNLISSASNDDKKKGVGFSVSFEAEVSSGEHMENISQHGLKQLSNRGAVKNKELSISNTDETQDTRIEHDKKNSDEVEDGFLRLS